MLPLLVSSGAWIMMLFVLVKWGEGTRNLKLF